MGRAKADPREARVETRTRALSRRQRRLVQKNLGLVRYLVGWRVPAMRRAGRRVDFDELFQEGCGGLIQAAGAYDPAGRVEFPAYASRRIKRAVYGALPDRHVSLGIRRRRGRRPQRPRLVHRERAGQAAALRSSRTDPRQDPTRPADGVTIGDRVREKLDEALRTAAGRPVRPGRRPDYRRLVRRVVADRLRVPAPENRAGIRELARRTGSSCARVMACERRLKREVRRVLDDDPEFTRLLGLARRSRYGMDEIWEPLGGLARVAAGGNHG